jgi:hypothetical protein
MATSILLDAPARTDERRRRPDRRAGERDRRRARRDRRRGARDPRPVAVERRVAERRSGLPDRRLGGDRRGVLRPAAAGPPVVDPDLVFWAVNIVCWAAITVVALVYGI